MNRSSLLMRFLCTILATLLALPAAGDVLVLTDGRRLIGEATSRTNLTINFRHIENRAWTTRTFARAQVRELIEEPGDQSDAGERRDDDDDGEETREQVRDSAEPPRVPSRPRAHIARIAVIPLHGQVGGTVDERVHGTFDAPLLQKCFEEARAQHAELVILDIHSPGGLIGEMEAICDTILQWHDDLRIVAHTHDAFSAAAIVTLCCREVLVRPDSRIGAATIVQRDDSGGIAAVEAKMASPHYARQRQYMAQSGHPYEVVAAMTIQETQLWWSPREGFRSDQPAEPGEWTQVDGASTILTMTADDAIEWGIAQAVAADAGAAARAVGIEKEIELLDFRETVAQHNADLDRRLDELKSHFTSYFYSLSELKQKMAAMFEAHQHGDGDAVRHMQRDIPREVAKIRNAGRQILLADRSALARRITVPDDFVSRVEEDGDLVSGISRLISSNDIERWNEAAERLNQVIERWRETLGF